MKRSRQRAYSHGLLAEGVALFYLRCKGYRLLARRFRAHGGEIDLIMRRGKVTAFVEVKYRPSPLQGLEAVGAGQIHRIQAAASSYMTIDPTTAQQICRFDIVTISPYRLPCHFENAFYGRN